MHKVKTPSGTEQIPIYGNTDEISGEVVLKVAPGKKVEHQGVKIELFGVIEMYYDRGSHSQFLCDVKELEVPKTVKGPQVSGCSGFLSPRAHASPLGLEQRWKFTFKDHKAPYESYNGINVRCR